MKAYWQLLFLVLGTFFFAIDRISKILAFKLPAEGFFYWQEILGIKLFLNKGIAFGVPLPQTIGIILSASITVIVIYFFVKNKYSNIGLIFIIIGAISNLLDRIKYEAIVDLFTIKFLPIFNLADLYILLGLAILIINYKKPQIKLF